MQRAPLLPRARWIILAGGVLIFAGFAWLLVFVSLPYPDPTPEMLARERTHHRIGNTLLLVGLVMLTAGLMLRLIQAVMRI